MQTMIYGQRPYTETYKCRMVYAHMRAALAYALASYAVRLQVGGLLVDPETDQPVCIGWNGTPPGEENICETETPQGLVSKDNVVHAETNMLLRMPQRGEFDMFISDSPCVNCAQQIVNSRRVRAVFFHRRYRLDEGILYLLNNGVKVFHLQDLNPNKKCIVELLAINGKIFTQDARWSNKNRMYIPI